MIKVEKKIEKISPLITKMRRELHQNPELSFKESETCEYIINRLGDLDIDIIEKTFNTGVLAYIKGNGGNKTIAFRADIDALPIVEETNVKYSSNNDGLMHACGHDGHTAILLGLATYLSANKEKLTDSVLLIFQPAEEQSPGGAKPIIMEGVLEKYRVDCIYGLHLYPEFDEGKIGIKAGPMMAQTGEFDIQIKGVSGHGAMPQNCQDSIVIASELINSIQKIVSRNIDPAEPALISIGKIQGGVRRSVIAGEVTMEGTMRAYSDSVYEVMKSKLELLAMCIAKANDCEINVTFQGTYLSVNNDKRMVDNFIDAIGKENIEFPKPQMTSEDFSFYQRVVPGLFFFLGVKNEEKGFTYPLHNSRFNFDEDILSVGVQIYKDILTHNNSLKK